MKKSLPSARTFLKTAIRRAWSCAALLVTILAGAARASDISFWVSPCNNPATRCVEGDSELARWALEAWEKVAGKQLHFIEADRASAQFRMVWALPARGVYGETVLIEVNGARGAQIIP